MDDYDDMLKDFDMDREYTNEDFDRMLIPLYDEDGHPFMDQFEYMDAVAHNNDVEMLRREYFSRKRRGRGKNRP